MHFLPFDLADPGKSTFRAYIKRVILWWLFGESICLVSVVVIQVLFPVGFFQGNIQAIIVGTVYAVVTAPFMARFKVVAKPKK